jgi:RoxA-like, cytochrome c-like
VALWALALCVGCRPVPPPAPTHDAATRPPPPVSPIENVVNPWLWTTAAGATDAEKATEDIGPYEPMPNMAGAVNTNAHYWTTNVGIAWDRDVDLDFVGEPVDLDGDGKPDTRVTRHVHAKGGVLANPALFGLTPTPVDPRGHVGQISVSTGVLGLREALRPNGQRSGEIGMTCWLCHGAGDPSTNEPVLGLPGTRFDYGLLLATAAVLDDANTEVVAYRKARGFPSGRAVRARLLLAGPGRQDLTGEFGLDVTVPFHSARYAGARRVRQGTKGLVNPISVPGILAAPGLALENWSGSENADAPWLARLVALVGKPEADVLAAFGLGATDPAASRRALLLDLRNLGTLGLQQDSFPGLLFADALAGRAGATLTPEDAVAIPRMYATVAVRRALVDPAAVTRPTVDLARVARGRALFVDRVVGEIANRQILQSAPRAFAAAKLAGPILAPIDPTRPLEAKLAVRCADCHNAAPLDRALPLAENPPPLGRCSHCHVAHPELPGVGTATAGAEVPRDADDDARLVSLRALPVPVAADAEVAYCARCHTQHRAFGPMVFSGSRLFPFDANGDGDAQLHAEADARAGGIGTEPLLAFDVPRPEWPFALDLPVIGADPAQPAKVTRARVGVSWVRTAPLTAISATAPYLHNGSVPTLRALLEPAPRRPVTFPLGAAGFVFDTRVPGNRNTGHEFGTKLKPAEKDDLVAFLQTL